MASYLVIFTMYSIVCLFCLQFVQRKKQMRTDGYAEKDMIETFGFQTFSSESEVPGTDFYFYIIFIPNISKL